VSKENLADVYMSFKSGTDSRYPLEEMPIVKGMNGIASRIDDMEVVRPDGTRSLLEVHGAPLADEHGRIWGSLVSFGDITEKKQKEGRINALLAEKENLLKEVHHRIKNNMAVMEALLQLKSSTLKDPSARHALKEAESHLHSMGILYDKLYQSSGSYEAVSTKEYLPALVKEVVALFPNSPKVKVETKVQDFAIDIKEMSSLGIILNEVITNSMKYAFPGNREGTIAVDAARTGKSVRIAIGDDGVGIPDGIGLDTSDGFGFHLISTLSRQLNATVTIEREKGTTFVIEF
jgi:two-component sensor histidine kinase